MTAVKETVMKVLVRHTVLILFAWLMLAGVCLGKQVYLKDGGIIDAQSAWQKGGKVFVKVNRDIIAEFDPSEIDLRRTFPKTGSHSRHVRHKAHTRTATPPAEHALDSAPDALAPAASKPAPKPAVAPPAPKPAGQPAAPATTPASKSAIPPSPAPAAVTKEPAQPTASPEVSADPAPPLDKAEQQRRVQEAAKMMIEAALKKDSELMKKALEMQKSAMPQQGAVAEQKGFPVSILLAVLAACLMIIVGHWIIFQKAGQAGWKCLIPFYNMYVLMEISGKPGWWMFLLFVPLVGIVILLFALLSLAKKFGRSELFGVGLLLLPMIFYPVLAFGGSEYEG
jgi:hypothetical protein